MGDVLDPPAGRAEREHVTDPRLVDHLLVELADPAAGPLAADQEDPEEAAVGDRAAAGDGQPLGARPAGELAGHAVPDDARPQLGELVARVAPAEQVEGRVERAARQLGVRRGAARRGRRGRRPTRPPSPPSTTTCWASTSSGLVGMRIDSISARAHPLDRDRGLGEVAAVLGEQHAPADLADLVAGPAHALQRAGDARRRLDLDDQVDRAHVDAELEAAGGDDAGEPAALEVVLDEGPLLLGDRAVVGLRDHRCGAGGRAGLRHDLRRAACAGGRAESRPSTPHACPLGGDLVEARGEPLGEPAGVGEDDRGAVLLDQVGHVVLHVGPDRGRLAAVARRPRRSRRTARGRSCPRPGRRP